MTVTVKTTFPMNENGNISEMDGTFCLKRHDERLCITILISFKSKAGIKEPGKNLTVLKGAMPKERRVVIEKLAFETQLAGSPIEDGGQSSQDKWKNPKHRVKWKEISHIVAELGLLVKEKKKALVSKAARKSQKEKSKSVLYQEVWLKIRKLMMVSEPESTKD